MTNSETFKSLIIFTEYALPSGVIKKVRLYTPWNRSLAALEQNTRNAVQEHLVDEQTDDQSSHLDADDVQLGVETRGDRGRVQEEDVGLVVQRVAHVLESLLV